MKLLIRYLIGISIINFGVGGFAYIQLTLSRVKLRQF